jgi:hypothetical protein
MQRVLGVHDVEGRGLERKLFCVRDAEAEAGPIPPGVESFDVDRHDFAYPLPDQPRDAAVPAAAVEYRFVPVESEPELVEAPQTVTKLAGRQAARVLTA